MSDNPDPRDNNVRASMPEPGKVNSMRNAWLVHEDGAFANRLQNQEFDHKYSFNRTERSTARQDVPLAKFVQTEEEERLQRERLELLETQNSIAKRDAELAEEMHKLDEERNRYSQRNLEIDDAAVAQRIQQEELFKVEQERIRAEIRDQEYARMIYEKERTKYEKHIQRRELARERRRIEAETQQDAENLLSGYKQENRSPPGAQEPSHPLSALNESLQRFGQLSLDESDPQQTKMLRTDGRVEDLGDFSDFYIPPDQKMAPAERRHLQELQDEELARLLQDQEKKRGATIDKTALRQIEERDAELARVIQEQEKLKAKRRHRPGPRHRSDQTPSPVESREPVRHMRSDPGDMGPPIPHKTETAFEYHEYEHQNSHNERYSSQSSHRSQSSVNESPPYSTRPLPQTPEESNERVTVVSIRGQPPGSTPPPGYRPPPEYPNPRRPPNPPRDDSFPQNLNSSNNRETKKSRSSPSNVIASIDPTYDPRQQNNDSPYTSRGIPTQEPAYRDAMEETHTNGAERQHQPQHLGAEDAYCDLDDLGPIQGQRRTLPRDGRQGSKNCKQQ